MESAADPAAPGAERRIFWIAAVVVVVLDLITKMWPRPSCCARRGSRCWATGSSSAWSTTRGRPSGCTWGPYSRWIFLTVAIVAVVVLPRMSRTSPPGDWFRQLALGLVAGGAAGNLIDRIRSTRGVVDFLDVGIGALRWPTFNVADIAVSCGAIALVVSMWREDVRQPEPPAAPVLQGHDAE